MARRELSIGESRKLRKEQRKKEKQKEEANTKFWIENLVQACTYQVVVASGLVDQGLLLKIKQSVKERVALEVAADIWNHPTIYARFVRFIHEYKVETQGSFLSSFLLDGDNRNGKALS